jgi:hypothetical protein
MTMLSQFTRNMMHQLGGRNVDAGYDRIGNISRLEPTSAGFREASSGSDVLMGKGQVGGLDWPEVNSNPVVLCSCRNVCRGANPGVTCRKQPRS